MKKAVRVTPKHRANVVVPVEYKQDDNVNYYNKIKTLLATPCYKKNVATANELMNYVLLYIRTGRVLPQSDVALIETYLAASNPYYYIERDIDKDPNVRGKIKE